MNWDDAKCLLAVARTGQMLAAAKRLGMTQATLSRRIASLEQALDTQLVIRRAHGSDLSEDGLALVGRFERVEAEMNAAQAALRREEASLSGSVRIGAPDGLGLSFVAPRLGRLAASHPNLQIELVPVTRSFSLSQREADIAIMVGRPEKGRLVARKLTDYSLHLYASPDYLAQHGRPTVPQDLSDHRLIGYVEDLISTPELNYSAEFLRNWKSAIAISSATGQMTAVRSGAGIGILHDFMVAEDLKLKRLLPELSVSRSFWIAWHESLRDLPRIKATAEFLVNEVAKDRHRFLSA